LIPASTNKTLARRPICLHHRGRAALQRRV